VKIRPALALSIQILGAHRLRTALSVCGLLVGVAAVMVMTAIGEGAERRILERVHAMGTDLLVVSAAPATRVAGRERQSSVSTVLREEHAEAIVEESRYAVTAAPAVAAPTNLHYDGRTVPTLLHGTTTAGLRLQRVELASGRIFDEVEERERRRVAVLGARIAGSLFPGEDPIGHTFRIGGVPFEVVGIAAPRGSDPGGADLDDMVLVPLGTAMRRVLNIPYVHTILVQATTMGDLDPLEAEVRDILGQRIRAGSGASEPFRLLNQADLVRTARATSGAFTSLIVSVAGLALLVGGLGILVVTRIAVRERTREIGLRRALGARVRDIHLQFVLESGLLASGGAVAGVLAGFLISAVGSIVGPWEMVFPWRAAVLGVVCSVSVGVAAGLIPAKRAALQQPVQALRGE
jgi:putative ABC transport system permease protein